MEQLDKIDINDVRFLIKRLIKGGYDKKIPIRPSEQEILSSLESSQLILKHLATVREDVDVAKSSVQLETRFLQEMMLDICSLVQPILNITKAEVDLSVEYKDLFLSLQSNQHEHDDFDESNQAIDSDEEAKLFEELDALMEAQERAFTFKGNAHQLMAQTFQKVSRRLIELENAYDLVRPAVTFRVLFSN